MSLDLRLFCFVFACFLSWFCNFAIGIPHHNIVDKRRTTYPRGPHSHRRKIHHGRYIIWLRTVFFTFACCQGEEWVCFQAGRLHQVGLLVSETLSLSLSLSLYRVWTLSLVSMDWIDHIPWCFSFCTSIIHILC